MESSLGLLACDDVSLPQNGPSAILLTRVRRLGWAVGGQGLLQDRFGSFSLMSLPWDELCLRFRLAWGHVLAAELGHRPTFAGLDRVDLPELHRVLSTFGPVDQVYLRCHLDGTFFTQNAKAHFRADTSSKCPWCPAKDGFFHRAWECPFFAPCRAHLSSAQLAMVHQCPPCLRDHGWPVLLPEWELFCSLLLRDDGFCKLSPVAPPTNRGEGVLDLFVDGTSAWPTEPKLRFGAWVVTMVPGGIGTFDNRVLMGGHVLGLNQSPYRAELTAVFQAVAWASRVQQRIRIWCDCQGVVRGFVKLLQGRMPKKNGAHSDLWAQIWDQFQLHSHLFDIRKVVSHGALHQAQSPLEEWVYWHNGLADSAADSITFADRWSFGSCGWG